MVKPSLRQQQAIARRQQILDVAVQLFARQGVTGTTTKQIAQEIGVAEGLIFHYFPTKRDLLRAILESHHSYVNEFKSLLQDAAEQPPSDVLRRVADGWLTTLRREVAFTSMLLSEAQIDPMVGEVLRTLIHEGQTRLAAYLETQQRSGVLQAGSDTKMLAHMFLSSIIIFFMLNRDVESAEWQIRRSAFVENLLNTWRSLAC